MKTLPEPLQVRAPVILAVDDQEPNIRLVGTVLSAAGYDVIPALNGKQALARSAARTPDLVLLDMRMPGMDGFEVAEELRRNPATAKVPVIFLTAASERESLVRAFSSGAVDYIVKPFVAEELTARVRAHVGLKLARDHLERVAREREEIVALVAHDLKNPLSSIRFSTQLLRRASADSERAERLIGSIAQSADRGLAQIQRYLSKREDVELRRNMSLSAVRLDDALRYACDRFSVQAEARAISLDCENFADVSVMADVDALAHVLDNLISNALKHSPEQTSVAVLMGGGSAGNARIAVLDRGPGVSKERQQQLFRRFVRLGDGEQAQPESTGLGLALAKQDVEQMGGSLWYEDRPEGGAAFILELPLAERVAEQGNAASMPATDGECGDCE